jgi:RNA polymerase sigma-70 factor (ECF subfamily)
MRLRSPSRGTPFLAEEVLQDCFVKAYRVRERLDPGRSPLPWLQRVTINLCYSRVSRRKALAEPITSLITNLVVDLSARPGPGGRVARGARRPPARNRRAATEAADRDHPLLPHGYSLAEAAEIADCNVGTMKSRLHYALKALRARLPVERSHPRWSAVTRQSDEPMKCRRICRELLWLARFGEFGPSSQPHLDHLANCRGCRDEVGFDRAMVEQLRIALAERIADAAPSPSAFDRIWARAQTPEPRPAARLWGGRPPSSAACASRPPWPVPVWRSSWRST